MEKEPSTTQDVRRANRQRVLRLLFQRGSTSRQEIAAGLGMSMPTVLLIVRDLEEMGLAEERGVYGSTGGRPAAVISSRPEAWTALGVDVTRDDVGLVLTDLSGRLVRHRRVEGTYRDAADYYAWLGGIAERFLAEVDGERLLGTGVSVAGILSEDGARLAESHTLGVREVDCGRFRAVLPQPCLFLNDANAAGLAELAEVGDRRGLAYLSLSNTVGGAIFLDGRLYEGTTRRGGEFGHMRLVPGGRRCYCGQEGCADAYLGAHCLARSPGGLERFFQRVEQGDCEDLRRWEEYLDYLALAVVNLRMALDCDVVLGGYVGAYLEPWIPRLRAKVMALDPFRGDAECVSACLFKWEASAYGAAMQLVRLFFERV